MRKLLQSLFILIFIAGSAIAQNRVLTGTVTAAGGNTPLPGVSVKVRGAQVGASTDANGKYSLSVPSAATVLEFSSIGFIPQNKTIGTATIINISLVQEDKVLGEVVVVGYGTISKKDNTASVSRISGNQVTDV